MFTICCKSFGRFLVIAILIVGVVCRLLNFPYVRHLLNDLILLGQSVANLTVRLLKLMLKCVDVNDGLSHRFDRVEGFVEFAQGYRAVLEIIATPIIPNLNLLVAQLFRQIYLVLVHYFDLSSLIYSFG